MTATLTTMATDKGLKLVRPQVRGSRKSRPLRLLQRPSISRKSSSRGSNSGHMSHGSQVPHMVSSRVCHAPMVLLSTMMQMQR